MKTTIIPGTDLTVSALCLGLQNMGCGLSQTQSFALLDRFTERGGTFVDTALVYSNWLPGEKSSSEKTLGRWLKERGSRRRVCIATKGAHPSIGSSVPRLSRAEIDADASESLSNLHIDCIDYYWLHRDDPARPAEDIIDTMNGLVRAGKIRHFGCSNWKAPRIEAANGYARSSGQAGFTGNQMCWSVAVARPDQMPDRTVVAMDAVLLEYHKRTGLAAIPFSSQARGLFHKLERGGPPSLEGAWGFYPKEDNLARYQRIREVADETGLSVSQLVLAWLQSQSFPVVPIVGCQSLAQLDDSIRAAGLTVTEAQRLHIGG
jgi:aryl-alcohol dehydrogenase-like predicted oxidoreductase